MSSTEHGSLYFLSPMKMELSLISRVGKPNIQQGHYTFRDQFEIVTSLPAPVSSNDYGAGIMLIVGWAVINKMMWSLSSCVLEFPCLFPPYNQIRKLTPEPFLWDKPGNNCSFHPSKNEVHCSITCSFTIHESDHESQTWESLSLAGLTKMQEFLNRYFTLVICT